MKRNYLRGSYPGNSRAGDNHPMKRPEVAAKQAATVRRINAIGKAALAAGYTLDDKGKLVKVKS